MNIVIRHLEIYTKIMDVWVICYILPWLFITIAIEYNKSWMLNTKFTSSPWPSSIPEDRTQRLRANAQRRPLPARPLIDLGR